MELEAGREGICPLLVLRSVAEAAKDPWSIDCCGCCAMLPSGDTSVASASSEFGSRCFLGRPGLLFCVG